MKFLEYPEERIYDIIYYILFLFLIIFILAASGTKGFYIFLFSAVSTGAWLFFLFFSFRRTEKEADRISRLVEQMLYYARSENPENDYFIRKTSLDEIVHDVILKYRRYLIESNVNLNIILDNDIVYTDIKWLTFILSQIVQNSIKYFDKPDKILSIQTSDRPTSVVLIIEDNGCGIPAADLPRIFEKGFTGSDRSCTNATGMGLYLARKLALRLGLNLTAESVEGEYTRILLSFPKGTVHRFDR